MAEDLKLVGIIATLSSTYFFEGLDGPDIKQIAAFTSLHTIPKDAYLFRHGEKTKGFFVVRSGAINVHRNAPDGREQVIHIFRPGESLAEAVLAGEAGYPADARAISKSEVLMIPKIEMLRLLAQRPELALRMLGSMSMHLRTLVNALDDLTLKDAESRFIHWLIKPCPRPLANKAVKIDLSIHKNILASEIGVRQETLSRLFAKFQKQKMISVKGRLITIHNPLALSQLIHHKQFLKHSCS